MSMPVTVNAAEKEDVLGTWTGSSWAGVTFDEEGHKISGTKNLI